MMMMMMMIMWKVEVATSCF